MILRQQGELTAALEEFRVANGIRRLIVASNPQNAKWSFDLSLNHNQIGFILQSLGDHAGAAVEYQARKSVVEGLIELDPQNLRWQRELEASQLTLGGALQRLGEESAGRESLQRAAELYEKTADSSDDFYNAGCV